MPETPETLKAPNELLELAVLVLKERRLLKDLIAVRLDKAELEHRTRVLGMRSRG